MEKGMQNPRSLATIEMDILIMPHPDQATTSTRGGDSRLGVMRRAKGERTYQRPAVCEGLVERVEGRPVGGGAGEAKGPRKERR